MFLHLRYKAKLLLAKLFLRNYIPGNGSPENELKKNSKSS